jgi:hypothetical protein
MNLYLFFSIYFIVIGFISYFLKNKKTFNFFLLISFFSIVFLLSILRRLDVGNDTISYKKIFDNVLLLGVNTNPEIEKGFLLLVYIFTIFSEDYYLFIFFYSLFVLFSLYLFVSKFSDNVLISIILFFLLFFSSYFNLFRQIISLTISIFSFESLRRKNWIQFIISFLFAFSFHTSSLIILLFPLFFSVKFNLFSSLLLLFLSVFFVFQREIIVDLFIFISGSDFYIQTDFAISTLFSLVLGILIHTIFLILLYFTYKSQLKNKLINFYSWSSTFSLVFALFGLHIWILNRLVLFLNLYYIVSFPYLLTNSKVSKVFSYSFIFILIIVIFVYNLGMLLLRPEWITEINYYFYFN